MESSLLSTTSSNDIVVLCSNNNGAKSSVSVEGATIKPDPPPPQITTDITATAACEPPTPPPRVADQVVVPDACEHPPGGVWWGCPGCGGNNADDTRPPNSIPTSEIPPETELRRIFETASDPNPSSKSTLAGAGAGAGGVGRIQRHMDMLRTLGGARRTFASWGRTTPTATIVEAIGVHARINGGAFEKLYTLAPSVSWNACAVLAPMFASCCTVRRGYDRILLALVAASGEFDRQTQGGESIVDFLLSMAQRTKSSIVHEIVALLNDKFQPCPGAAVVTKVATIILAKKRDTLTPPYWLCLTGLIPPIGSTVNVCVLETKTKTTPAVRIPVFCHKQAVLVAELRKFWNQKALLPTPTLAAAMSCIPMPGSTTTSSAASSGSTTTSSASSSSLGTTTTSSGTTTTSSASSGTTTTSSASSGSTTTSSASSGTTASSSSDETSDSTSSSSDDEWGDDDSVADPDYEPSSSSSSSSDSSSSSSDDERDSSSSSKPAAAQSSGTRKPTAVQTSRSQFRAIGAGGGGAASAVSSTTTTTTRRRQIFGGGDWSPTPNVGGSSAAQKRTRGSAPPPHPLPLPMMLNPPMMATPQRRRWSYPPVVGGPPLTPPFLLQRARYVCRRIQEIIDDRIPVDTKNELIALLFFSVLMGIISMGCKMIFAPSTAIVPPPPPTRQRTLHIGTNASVRPYFADD